MKFPKFKKEKKEEDKPEASSEKKEEKKGMLSGMMERIEQKQMGSSLPKMASSKPKPFSVAGIKYRLKEYKRVLKITKKPSTEEFKTIVKASGLGIIIIGVIGFAIHMVVQTIQSV